MSVRLPRLAVRLTEDRLEYVGFLLSWSAPRAGIDTVLDVAFVEWHDEHGIDHRRQIGR